MKNSLRMKILLLLFVLVVGSSAWADETLTLTATNLSLSTSGSYPSGEQTQTVGSITFKYTDLMQNNSTDKYIQAKASTGCIYNSTPFLSKIKSVAITHSGTARSTTIWGSADGENWTSIKTGSGSITGDFTSNSYYYFKITRGSNAAYWTQVVVTYETPHALTYSATSGGSITSVKFGNTNITSNTQVGQGLVLNIVATASDGYNFDGWTATGTGYSFGNANAATTTFTMGTTNCAITANFASAGPTQLPTPTNFSGTPGNEQISFTWDAVANASSYTISYTPAGGSETEVTGITGTNRTITGLENDKVHTCKIKAIGDGISYSNSDYSSTISVTPTGATYYTVTPTSPLTGGAVTASPVSATVGTTITLTATPADGYKFDNIVSNWSITPTTTITPVTSTNTATFSMPAANVTAVAATFTPYAVTLQAGTGTIGGGSSHTETWYITSNSGNLPTATSACSEKWVFEGWSETQVSVQTETKPTLVETAYIPTSDITLYAVYKKTEEGPNPTAFTVGSTGNYVIAAYNTSNSKYYALPTNPTVSSGKIEGSVITVSTKNSVKYVETSNASGYTWTIASATYGYSIYDGSKYIYHSNGGSSGTNLTYGNDTDKTWSFTAADNCIKMYGMSGSTINDRGMLFSGTTIGGYSLSNWNTSGYYKTMILPVVDGTKNYYISSPDCRDQVVTPVITLAGGSYNSDQTTTITCEEDDVTIYYTTDGTDPTNTSTEYISDITIDRSMTIKAIAIKDDASMSDSNIASATYVLPPVYANIAAFKAAYNATSDVIVKITGPLTTVYHNGKNLYVQDATGSMLIYDSDGSIVTRTYENGQTISNIYGHYELYNNLIEFVPDRDLSAPGVGSVVEPTDIELLTTANYATYDAKLVRLRDMIFDKGYSFYKDNASNANIEDDEYNSVQIRSRFKTLDGSVSAADMANVVGFVGINNSTIQLYPRDNNDIQMILGDMDVDDEVTIDFAAILGSGEILEVENGGILTIGGKFTNDGDIMVDNGGQLVINNTVEATIYKDITASNGTAGWYTISSPINNPLITDVSNLVTGASGFQYNLYRYNEEETNWEAYNLNSSSPSYHADFTNLMNGQGYLYRNNDGSYLSFNGNVNVGSVAVTLTSSEEAGTLRGFNLIGNPFAHNIYKGKGAAIDNAGLGDGYYFLNNNGGWQTETYATPIPPMMGILVQVSGDDNLDLTIQDKPTAATAERYANDYLMFTVANNQYEDVTYAMFHEGYGLNKIDHRNSDIPMLYINQNNENYAIAMMKDNTQSFNLNFKAMTMGQYTLNYKTSGEFNYLHVIDRITGNDIDMLLDGEYSFIGSPQDNEARFIVRLGYLPNYDDNGEDIFAYQNGSDIIISGEGELQIFDEMGRMISTQRVNGTKTISVNTKGVYVFRLIGSEIKTQKIVVR